MIVGLGLWGLAPQVVTAAEDSSTEGDSFFAGKVAEYSASKLTVTRTVLGKVENHTFKMIVSTKVEGKLSKKVRVTVRYISDDNGDTATLVVVRPPVPLPPK
jgi:hypothetical protein